MRWLCPVGSAGLAAAMLCSGAACRPLGHPRERLLLEVRVRQDMEEIRLSDFGEPPQIAVWLEDLATGGMRTLFVTRRSARGAWKGKSECAAALPRWFAVWREESGRSGLPTPQSPAPDAVTRATPTTEAFAWTAEVELGRRWVCWVEVNLAADFNEAFPQLDEAAGRMDTHFCGQPSLLYRGEVVAEEGARIVPELWGCTVPDTTTGEVSRDLGGITTARALLPSVEIRVLRR